MYYVVMTADRKFIRDASDDRHAALFIKRALAERVASFHPGARVLRAGDADKAAPVENLGTLL